MNRTALIRRPSLAWRACLVLAVAGLSAPAGAAEVYGGVSLLGVTLGAATAVNERLALRGEFSGGLKASRNGREEGVTYQGDLRLGRVGAYADWFPFSGRFRLTGGVNANQIKATLNSQGGEATINDKPVNLDGRYFNVELKYPTATPYLGIGWGHHHRPEGGLGFWADIGVSVGKFKFKVDTDIVGVDDITQEDVDAEVRKVRDALNKLPVLPYVALGLNWQF
ncbi:MAG: hypothetical protein RIQ53_3613 [Pseudomonadota bacterium]